jgi:hypothetical protein
MLMLKAMYAVRTSNTRVPMTARERNAKLHLKNVPTLGAISSPMDPYAPLLAVAQRTSYHPDLVFQLGWNTDASRYANVPRPENQIRSDVKKSDIKKMLKAKVIRRIKPEHVKSYGKLFFVYEEDKDRRRMILWPEDVNEHILFNSHIDLPMLVEQCMKVRPGQRAACFDLSAAFYQDPLTDDVGAYYCFATQSGECFALTVMDMGVRPASEVQHTITKVLAAADKPEHVDSMTYVDNADFRADVQHAEHLDRAVNQFRANCNEAGATLNKEPFNEPSNITEFLGLHRDHDRGQVSLMSKSVEKLKRARDTYHRAPTVQAFYELMGSLFHAAAVLRIQLSRFYYVVKAYRRLASQIARGVKTFSSEYTVWPSAKPLLDRWCEEAIANVPVSHFDVKNPRLTLYTDACTGTATRPGGWGAVLFAEGLVYTFSGLWSARDSKRSINELEAMALRLGLQATADIRGDNPIRIFVDNTSVLYGVQRGRSNAFHFNKRIGEVIDALAHTPFVINYIASELNVADAASRGIVHAVLLSERVQNRCPTDVAVGCRVRN